MSDKQFILSLGGPTEVARLLGYDKKSGPQRVWNWMARGIPARVKLENPEIFLSVNSEKLAGPSIQV